MALLSLSSREVKWVMYGLPVIILGLALFSVLMSLSHLQDCSPGEESAKEKTLRMAQMEKRLMTLEQEMLENSLLLEQFLQALDKRFEALKLVHLPEVQEAAHQEALRIAQRLAGDNPPPPPPKPRPAAAGGGGGGGGAAGWGWGQEAYEVPDDPVTLGQQIENAFLWKNSEFGDDAPPVAQNSAAGGGKAFQGEWLGDDDDEFLGWSEGAGEEEEEEEEDTRDAKEIAKDCITWKSEYSVVPGVSWGTLPQELQQKWLRSNCDFKLNDPSIFDLGG